jgi:hypothetical protein
VCLGNPEGRVSFGSLVTRGFRPSGDYLDPITTNGFPALFGRHDRVEDASVSSDGLGRRDVAVVTRHENTIAAFGTQNNERLRQDL